MAKKVSIIPTTIKAANVFVKDHHRHHRPTSRNTGKWAISAVDTEGNIVGVAIAGNPVSATFMDGFTIELTRICVLDSAPKGTCSFLLSKCCKIWKEMGGTRVITYTLATEAGSSLRGAGWKKTGTVKPHKRWTNKNKVDGIDRTHLEVYELKKYRWEKLLKEAV